MYQVKVLHTYKNKKIGNCKINVKIENFRVQLNDAIVYAYIVTLTGATDWQRKHVWIHLITQFN